MILQLSVLHPVVEERFGRGSGGLVGRLWEGLERVWRFDGGLVGGSNFLPLEFSS